MNNTMTIWRQETEFEKDRRLFSKEKEKHELNIKENEEIVEKQPIIKFNELEITKSDESLDVDTQYIK